MLQYAGIFIATFIVASAVSATAFNSFQQRSMAEPSLYSAVNESRPAADLVDNREYDQTVADTYIQHVVTVNDPNQGCGCPSCCSAT